MSRTCRGRAAVAVVLVLGLTACNTSLRSSPITRVTTGTPHSATTTTMPHSPTSRTERLSVSTTTLEAGGPITVSGTGCPKGDWAWASILPDNPNDGPAIFDTYLSQGGAGAESSLVTRGTRAMIAASNGTWIIHATVPMIFPVPSIIIATCYSNGELNPRPVTGIHYRPEHVSVTTPFALSVEPGTTVTAGSTLTVQANGGTCPEPAVTPIVALYESGDTAQVIANTMGDSRLGRYWQASLTVPSGLKTGHYQLEADCDYSRGAIFGSYAPVHITVK